MSGIENIKLSVCMICYNQERFIEQALLSAVRQKTSFDYEIIVGDDCSTDKTLGIIKKIKNEHPHKVKILHRKKNLGALANALDTQQHCKGEYVAFLEGDDFWTDDHKLQKQVEYMEHNPDYVMCFTNAIEFYEDGTNREPIVEGPPQKKTYFTIMDIIEGNFIPTPTVVYRNGLIKNYPDWFTKLNQCDWSLYVMLSKYGPIGYIPEITAARRAHQEGMWFGAKHTTHIKSRIKSLEKYDEYLNYRYTSVIAKVKNGHIFKLAVAYESLGELALAKELIKSPHRFIFNEYVNKYAIAKLICKFLLPSKIKKYFRKSTTENSSQR